MNMDMIDKYSSSSHSDSSCSEDFESDSLESIGSNDEIFVTKMSHSNSSNESSQSDANSDLTFYKKLTWFDTYICDKEEMPTINDFEIGKPLGNGKFGNIYLGRVKNRKQVIAIKVVYFSQIKRAKLRHQMEREINIHRMMDHPNIVKMYGFFCDRQRGYLLLEYQANGNLYDYMKTFPRNRIPKRKVQIFIQEVIEALKYCHSKNVIHRDLKPENLLLDSEEHIKLADFGWSVIIENNRRTTLCGTLDYLAPEIVINEPHGKEVDMWCVGVLTYEFLQGVPPFIADTYRDTYDNIKNVRYEFPKHFPKNAKDFISRALRKEPENRISLENMLQHDWIK